MISKHGSVRPKAVDGISIIGPLKAGVVHVFEPLTRKVRPPWPATHEQPEAQHYGNDEDAAPSHWYGYSDEWLLIAQPYLSWGYGREVRES